MQTPLEPRPAPAPADDRGREARAFLARRAEEEARAARAILESVRAALPAIAARLVALGAAEVHAFGSVVRGDFFSTSDLDLATRGLPPERWLEAKVAASDLSPVPCDLIELETAPAALLAVVLGEGRRIDGAP
jgi:predicted nucleotidyltransferase